MVKTTEVLWVDCLSGCSLKSAIMGVLYHGYWQVLQVKVVIYYSNGKEHLFYSDPECHLCQKPCPDKCGFISMLSLLYLSFIFIPILVSKPEEGDGTPLQCSCLGNPMDRGAWWATVHGVTKSWTWLNNFTFTFPFHALEKEMATHSSVLAWRIPGTEEPGGLLSMGSHRVGHDWSDLAAAAAAAAIMSKPYCLMKCGFIITLHICYSQVLSSQSILLIWVS